jgi:hypothetical protein
MTLEYKLVQTISVIYVQHSARNESTFLMAAIFLKVALGK